MRVGGWTKPCSGRHAIGLLEPVRCALPQNLTTQQTYKPHILELALRSAQPIVRASLRVLDLQARLPDEGAYVGVCLYAKV
jgi:hypothetical protein